MLPQPFRTAMLRLALIDLVITISLASPPTSPKRGLALKSESVCDDLSLFSSLRPWFYGWGSAPSSSDYSKCAHQHDSGFIPMVWGRRAVSVDVWPNTAALLGFNEPNHKQQSNLQPAEAAVCNGGYIRKYSLIQNNPELRINDKDELVFKEVNSLD